MHRRPQSFIRLWNSAKAARHDLSASRLVHSTNGVAGNDCVAAHTLNRRSSTDALTQRIARRNRGAQLATATFQRGGVRIPRRIALVERAGVER